MVFTPEKMELQPPTADNTTFLANLNKQYMVSKKHGTLLLKYTHVGYKYTFCSIQNRNGNSPPPIIHQGIPFLVKL